MGYDVVNVGEKDLMMGGGFLADLAQKSTFEFVSANLVGKKSHQSIFKPYVIKEISGLKIGIFGLLDNRFEPLLQEKDPGLAIEDPFLASKSVARNLRDRCDLVILLSQLGESKDKKLARENPQIDLILGGGEALKAVVERVNEIPIYRLEPRGGYLGRLDYFLADAKKPIRFLVSSERDELEKRLERLNKRAIQIQAEIAKTGRPNEMKTKELNFLESRQKEVEKSLNAFQDKNFYQYMAIPVQLSIEDDPKMMKGIEHYRAESAKLYKPKVASFPGKDLSEKEMLARIPKESLFVGAISCKRCHEVNYRNWLKTKHAKASQTIAASPQYAQEECLICHSTGYGKIGEYATIDEIPFFLKGVQCESCHGPGRGHPGKGRIDRKVTLGVCRNCHTKDQSPTFNYAAYLEKIGCNITK